MNVAISVPSVGANILATQEEDAMIYLLLSICYDWISLKEK